MPIRPSEPPQPTEAKVAPPKPSPAQLREQMLKIPADKFKVVMEKQDDRTLRYAFELLKIGLEKEFAQLGNTSQMTQVEIARAMNKFLPKDTPPEFKQKVLFLIAEQRKSANALKQIQTASSLQAVATPIAPQLKPTEAPPIKDYSPTQVTDALAILQQTYTAFFTGLGDTSHMTLTDIAKAMPKDMPPKDKQQIIALITRQRAFSTTPLIELTTAKNVSIMTFPKSSESVRVENLDEQARRLLTLAKICHEVVFDKTKLTAAKFSNILVDLEYPLAPNLDQLIQLVQKDLPVDKSLRSLMPASAILNALAIISSEQTWQSIGNMTETVYTMAVGASTASRTEQISIRDQPIRSVLMVLLPEERFRKDFANPADFNNYQKVRTAILDGLVEFVKPASKFLYLPDELKPFFRALDTVGYLPKPEDQPVKELITVKPAPINPAIAETRTLLEATKLTSISLTREFAKPVPSTSTIAQELATLIQTDKIPPDYIPRAYTQYAHLRRLKNPATSKEEIKQLESFFSLTKQLYNYQELPDSSANQQVIAVLSKSAKDLYNKLQEKYFEDTTALAGFGDVKSTQPSFENATIVPKNQQEIDFAKERLGVATNALMPAHKETAKIENTHEDDLLVVEALFDVPLTITKIGANLQQTPTIVHRPLIVSLEKEHKLVNMVRWRLTQPITVTNGSMCNLLLSQSTNIAVMNDSNFNAFETKFSPSPDRKIPVFQVDADSTIYLNNITIDGQLPSVLFSIKKGGKITFDDAITIAGRKINIPQPIEITATDADINIASLDDLVEKYVRGTVKAESVVRVPLAESLSTAGVGKRDKNTIVASELLQENPQSSELILDNNDIRLIKINQGSIFTRGNSFLRVNYNLGRILLGLREDISNYKEYHYSWGLIDNIGPHQNTTQTIGLHTCSSAHIPELYEHLYLHINDFASAYVEEIKDSSSIKNYDGHFTLLFVPHSQKVSPYMMLDRELPQIAEISPENARQKGYQLVKQDDKNFVIMSATDNKKQKGLAVFEKITFKVGGKEETQLVFVDGRKANKDGINQLHERLLAKTNIDFSKLIQAPEFSVDTSQLPLAYEGNPYNVSAKLWNTIWKDVVADFPRGSHSLTNQPISTQVNEKLAHNSSGYFSGSKERLGTELAEILSNYVPDKDIVKDQIKVDRIVIDGQTCVANITIPLSNNLLSKNNYVTVEILLQAFPNQPTVMKGNIIAQGRRAKGIARILQKKFFDNPQQNVLEDQLNISQSGETYFTLTKEGFEIVAVQDSFTFSKLLGVLAHLPLKQTSQHQTFMMEDLFKNYFSYEVFNHDNMHLSQKETRKIIMTVLDNWQKVKEVNASDILQRIKRRDLRLCNIYDGLVKAYNATHKTPLPENGGDKILTLMMAGKMDLILPEGEVTAGQKQAAYSAISILETYVE